MPVNLVGRAGYGRVGSVLLPPYVIAHHRDRRRALLVVRIGHQAADPGLYAESPEEIAGNEILVARIGLRLGARAADAERRIPRLQCRQVCELGRFRTKIPVGLPREQREICVVTLGIATPVTAADLIADPPQFL